MSQTMNFNKELNNLYTLLESVKQKRLGLDWQSKIFYNDLEKEVVEKIKAMESNLHSTDMVK